MKPRKSTPFRSSQLLALAFSATVFCHFAASSASAQALYWDNSAGGGFGTAGGTWSSTASLWTADAAGTGAAPGNTISTTSDTVNFGTGTLGLAAGTVTVSGTVDAGNITFDDNSGNIILAAVSAGTINLGAAATINNGGKVNTFNSALSGAGTSLAFSGGGTVIFTGAGAAGFGAGANATVSGGTALRFSTGGFGALGGATGFNINLGNATTGGALQFGNSGSVTNQITVVAGTGTRTLTNSGSPSGSFAGTIIVNENLTVSNSGVNTINTTGAGPSTIATGKTVTYNTSGGQMTNSAIFGGLGAIAYTASSTGNIVVSGAKTYSGGTTLNAMSGTGAVQVNTSSTGPANAPTDGAFGTGTLTIGATKMRAATTADITVGNPITFSGNPTFTTVANEKSLIFSGDATLAATRTLTVDTGSTVAGSAVHFGGIISGSGFGITKAGVGELRVSGINTYSGATTLNAGKFTGVVGGSNSSSTVNLNNIAATLGILVADNTLSWTCSALTSSAAGVLEFNYGANVPSTTVSPLIVTNLADFTNTPSVNVVVDTALAVGTYPLMTWGTTSGTAPTAVTVSNMTLGTFSSLSVSGNTLNLVISAGSNIVVKENNTNNLNLGTSWVGGIAPDSTKIARWPNTVTTPNATFLGADLTFSGIVIESPSGLVTINAGNTLTLGAALIDIDLSSADTSGLTLNCPLAMDGDNRWEVAATRTLSLGGQISGAFAITKQGDGTAILSSPANNYSGATAVAAGTLQLGANNVIPDGIGNGNISVAGTLDLNGKSETVNGLSGAGIIDNTLTATSPILTVGANDQTSTFGGVIQSTAGTVNLNKTGNGTLTLGGANTFTGTVAIAASTGTLVVGNVAPLDNVTGINMGGGTTLRSSVNGAVINAPITLGGVGTTATIHASIFDGSGSTLIPFTLGGAITGDGDLILSGVETTNSYGLIILNAASSYTGSTRMDTVSAFAGGSPNNTNIFVRLGVENALPVTTTLTLDGGTGTGGGRFCELNLNGNNQTLAGLTNVTGNVDRSQEVYNTSATLATLTVNNTAPFTYTGKLGGQIGPAGSSGDNLALTKNGAGTFTISGANTYSGATTISGGTLALGALNTLPNASAVSIGAGTLSAATVGTETAGTLDVTGAATISLVAGAQVVFADSSGGGSATWGGTLNIVGFVSGSSLNFGSSTGLTAQQLSKISAAGFTNFGLDAEGDLTADPTGGSTFATWLAANAPATGFVTDSDNDGLSNGVENVLGSNPNAFNTGLTQISATSTSAIFKHTLNPTIASDVTYGYEWSTDLTEWKTTGQTNTGLTTATITPSAPVLGDVTVTVTITSGPSAKLFGRLAAKK